jgi:hypothetical protein
MVVVLMCGSASLWAGHSPGYPPGSAAGGKGSWCTASCTPSGAAGVALGRSGGATAPTAGGSAPGGPPDPAWGGGVPGSSSRDGSPTTAVPSFGSKRTIRLISLRHPPTASHGIQTL